MDREVPLLQPTGPESGPTVYYRGLHLYSSRRPEAAPDRLAAETPLLPETLILIPSFGLGYGVARLLERLPRHCHVLCVEHDPALWNLAHQARRDLSGRDHVTLLLAENLAPLKGFLDTLPAGRYRRVVSLPLCGGARLFPEFYRTVETFLADGIQTYWQNRMTLIHMGRLFIKNLFANLALLPSSHDVSALRLEKPVLAVGAGPSLSAVLPELRRLRERTEVLAVDTALPILLQSGIIPDYVLALEPQFINIGDFIGLPERSFTVIADLASSPQVIRHCADRGCPLCFFSSTFHPLGIWQRLEGSGLRPTSIPPLGSVGVAAVYLALLMSRGPVLLCGFDFSYPGRRTHAAGSPSSLSDLASSSRLRPAGQPEFVAITERPRITLAGKNDEKLESDLVLFSYAQRLAALLAREQRVYDLSPHGLPLGIPLLHNAEEIDQITGINARGEGVRSRPGGTARAQQTSIPDAWNQENVTRFLDGERALLLESDRVLTDMIAPAAPERGRLTDGQWEIVSRTDYSFFHLASKNVFPEYSRNQAAQAVIEARIMSERIRRLTRLL